MLARILQRCSVTAVALALCLAFLVQTRFWEASAEGETAPESLAQRVAGDAPSAPDALGVADAAGAVAEDDPSEPHTASEPFSSSTDPDLLRMGLAERLRAHVDSLALAGGHRSRVVFTEGNRWGTEYMLRRMREMTSRVSADTFYVERRSGGRYPLVNPVAIVPGQSDSLLVICAHTDASASRDAGWGRNWRTMPAPGADDNATGAAALLEILNVSLHSRSKPRYTLMFVGCNAEEKNPDYAGEARRNGHHLGSLHLAQRLKREGKKVRGIIVMDMVGWNPRATYVGLFASARSQWLARELAAHKDYLQLSLELPRVYGNCRNSDNESFDRLGLPAVLFMESCRPWRDEGRAPRNPTYHTGRDLPDRVTYTVLDKVTRLVAAYVVGR